jgi:outer membrane protein assembly factor BamB
MRQLTPLLTASGLLLATVVLGCKGPALTSGPTSAQEPTNWLCAGGDPSRRAAGHLADVPRDQIWTWSATDADMLLAPRPVIAVEGVVLVGTIRPGADARSKITAIDVSSGKRLWQQELSSWPAMAADHGFVAVAAGRRVEWVNARDGEVIWETDVPQCLSVLATGGRIYLSQCGQLVVLSATDGSEIWRAGAPQRHTEEEHLCAFLPPSVSGSALVLPHHGPRGQLVCLEPATGDEVWRQSVGSCIRAPVALTGNSAIVCTERAVFSLRQGDGEVQWETPLPSSDTGSLALAVSGGELFVSIGKEIWVLKSSTGEAASRIELPTELVGTTAHPFAVSDRLVVTLGYKWRLGKLKTVLTAIDRDSRRPVWSVSPSSGAPPWQLLLSEGRLLFASLEEVRCFGAAGEG